jgi:fatty acid hydroxylase family protein
VGDDRREVGRPVVGASPDTLEPCALARVGSVSLHSVCCCYEIVTILGGLAAYTGKRWVQKPKLIIHSNVRLPTGPLRWLLGAPELHHWHHDRDRSAGNYANLSPLMDLLFGTYRCPDHEPESVGINEPIAKSYVGQMLHPFLPRRAAPASCSASAEPLCIRSIQEDLHVAAGGTHER